MSTTRVSLGKYYIVLIFLVLATTMVLTVKMPANIPLVVKKEYKLQAVKGHWLKTETIDEEQINTKKVKKFVKQISPVDDTMEKPTDKILAVDRHFNRTTNNVNTAYLWTINNKLKVLTVMTIDEKINKAGILTIPLNTKLFRQGKETTIENIYMNGGRNFLINNLEELLEVKINNYVSIEQQSLVELSKLVGNFEVNGKMINMADAFEQTSSGKRSDDQDIVRALGKHMIQLSNLIKIPRIMWFASNKIDSNMINKDYWRFFKIYKKIDYNSMKKITLNGINVEENGQMYLLANDNVWHNVISDLIN